jgi:hypothetical protein
MSTDVAHRSKNVESEVKTNAGISGTCSLGIKIDMKVDSKWF